MSAFSKRFDIQVLDLETSKLIEIETDKFLLVHEDGKEHILRTEQFNVNDATLALVSIKELMREQLEKEISNIRTNETDQQFDQVFNEIFNDLIKELLDESIEFKDGE